MDAKFNVVCNHIIGLPAQGFLLETCPRCMGAGYYNAISYGTTGKVVTVVGFDKLSQQINKILIEDKRPSGYGFDYTILSGTITPATQTAVQSEVMRCIVYLQNLQRIERSRGFKYLPSEELSNTVSVDAQINPDDPRGIIVTLGIQTVSGFIGNVVTNIRR